MKIAVTSHSVSKHPVLRKEIDAFFPGSVFNESKGKPSNEDVIGFLNGCDGAIVGLEIIDEVVLKECPRLEIISKYGVGLDNLDMDACKRHGVEIGWTPGVNKLSVAELTLGFMLALLRNIVSGCEDLKHGEWKKYGGAELSGKTVGIIGVGNIGKEVIRLLKPFNCRILGNDIAEMAAYYEANNIEGVSKEKIFAEADIITLHVPLTALTENLINRNTLSAMKKTAFLINTARGAVVNKTDLKWALSNNVIAGAAVDVYPVEPETELDFLRLPNLICTPHRGGSSKEAVLAMGMSAIGHLRKYFKK